MRRINKYLPIIVSFLAIASGFPKVAYASDADHEEIFAVNSEAIIDESTEPVFDVAEAESDESTEVYRDTTARGDLDLNNTFIDGYIENNHDEDIYTINLQQPGFVTLTIQSYGSRDTDEVKPIYCHILWPGHSSEYINTCFTKGMKNSPGTNSFTTLLEAGTYEIQMEAVVALSANHDIVYKLKGEFEPVKNDENEPNNDFDTAMEIADGQEVNALICKTDTLDFYTFTVSKKANVSVIFVTKYPESRIQLFDGDKVKVEEWTHNSRENESNPHSYTVKKNLNPGKYYLRIDRYERVAGGLENLGRYSIKVKGLGTSSKKELVTGSVTVNGVKFKSLRDAFKAMNENKDYIIELETDMIGEPNLTIPKAPASVTINGNGKMIKIIGTTFTSNTNLKLNNVTIRTENKTGVQAKLTLNAKGDLETGEGVKLDAQKPVVKVVKTFKNTGDFNANSLTVSTMDLAGGLTVNKDDKVTVKTSIRSGSGSIVLGEGFNKPIVLQGTVEEGTIINITGAKQADGTQILKTNQKKIDPEKLSSAFNVSAITDNTVSSHLYYLKNGSACIFGDSIIYNGTAYGIWKDAVTRMNTDIKAGARELNVSLAGDVNAMGALTMPKSGYDLLTISSTGGQHKLIFTGDIRITGNTTISDDVILTKVNKKGEKAAGKVIVNRKYTYTGKDTF